MENSDGGNTMDNGNTLGATEIAVGSLLANRGGYGGGAWGGGWPAVGSLGAPYANMSTVQHGISHLEDCVRTGNTSLRDEFNNSNLIGLLFNQQQLVGQNHLEMTREIAAVRSESAKCCCELKTEIKDIEVSRLKDELAQARDSNNITATVAGVVQAIQQAHP